MKIFAALITFIVLVLIASFLFIYSGVYNVAATKPHKSLVKWVMHETMERSVKHQAKGIKPPTSLDESLVQTGFNHYSEMCEGCHGKPGVSPSELKTGFNHEPPDLSKGFEWSQAELFWIIKNGIKMSAMPGFGPTHSDEEIWGIVAFVNQLPNLSPEEYKAMAKKSEGIDIGHDGGHIRKHNHEHSHEH